MIIDATTSFAEERLTKVQKLQAAINRKKSRKLNDDMRKSEHLFITRKNGHVKDIAILDEFEDVRKKRLEKIAKIILIDHLKISLFESIVGRAHRLGLRNRS